MSFHRHPQAHVVDAARGASVVRLVTDADVARIEREMDPFGLAHQCCSPGGHQPISVGDAIVCFHCQRIFTP